MRKSIGQYVNVAGKASLKVNIMSVDLAKVFANNQQKEADAKVAQDLQILENQQEEMNEKIELSNEQQSFGSDSERLVSRSSSHN